MDFTIHQLQVLRKVSQAGSITRAAEALNLTQPAVSIQLRNLQRQFSEPLIEVIHKRVYLTDAGREVLAVSEDIIGAMESLKQRILSRRGEISGRLRLSVVSTGKYVMPYFISSFIRRHPAVELSLEVTNKQQVVKSLEDNAVDFSLVSMLPTNLSLNRLKLMPNYLVLVAARNYPVGGRLDRKSLGGHPMILREQGSATRQMMEDFLKRNALSAIRRLELSSNEAVKQAVLSGLGISVMPIIGLRNELHLKQIRILPFRGLPMKSDWNLVWLAGKALNPASTALIEHIRKESNSIIGQHFDWVERYVGR